MIHNMKEYIASKNSELSNRSQEKIEFFNHEN